MTDAGRARPPEERPDLVDDWRRRLAVLAAETGLRRVGMVAWRDLDDPEAGGSELHAHEIARRWAEAGVDVVVRTSGVAGAPVTAERDGYRSRRHAGRYRVFAEAPIELAAGRLGPIGHLDGLVEIWNGMPFMSPLWWRGPRLVFLHHVHAEMWNMVLPPRLARLGNLVESRLAPPLYRRSRVATLSRSSREEIVESLGLRPGRVSVVPPGVDQRFSTLPGRAGRTDHPLVLAVGRLVPVKQFERVVALAGPLAALHPGLEIVIAGEGYERARLEAAIAEAGAGGIVRLAGHVKDDELVELYRRAWVLVSASAREGWGMSVTEAGACGTPAVVSRIAGHLDAVEDGVTGLLFDNDDQFVKEVDRVLSDTVLRGRLSRAARERAGTRSWEATALGTFELLAAEARLQRRS